MTNGGFGSLHLPLSITTTKQDPIAVFFDPVLSRSVTYDVAVGYFSSNWVRDAANGIATFAMNGGKARWIISPNLNEEDFKAINTEAGEESFQKLIDRSFEELFDSLLEKPRTVISWMIRDRILEIKVAVPVNALSGIMHAKMGCFSDVDGNKIGFSGSYNLTGAAATNWEKIDIYSGLRSEENGYRISEIEAEFSDMWSGLDENIKVYTPTDRSLKRFINHSETTGRPYHSPSDRWPVFGPPAHLLQADHLRDYQEKAIASWLKNKGRGILAMATGTGKTVTALSAVSRVANSAQERGTQLAVVITAPYQHLADQWLEEAAGFGFEPLLCYGGTAKWIKEAQMALTDLEAAVSKTAMFIAVNDTFAGGQFQRLLASFPRNSLIVADEVHNLGSNHYSKNLPGNMRFRMGLSATPVRHGDELGTKAIEDYFGPSVFEFGLKDAIERDFLCRYYYYPVLCPFDEEEMFEYKGLSDQIAKAFARTSMDNSEPNDYLKNLLIKRARLVSRLKSKITLLADLLADRKDSAYNLIYCGDATLDDERQIEKVLRLVGHELGMRVNKFTSEESTTQRQALLSDFSTGHLQALAAIRCLDEGVDVPRTETAYILASSTNPRQFIQRRGRVLRKSPGKKFAKIFDFIAVPDVNRLTNDDGSVSNVERNLVRREMERVNEFAEMAINRGEALALVSELKSKLNLLDV